MTSNDPCPRCGDEDVSLVDPTEEVWDLKLDEDYFDEEAEVWLCTACGWHEEATLEESLEEADANLAWIIDRMAW